MKEDSHPIGHVKEDSHPTGYVKEAQVEGCQECQAERSDEAFVVLNENRRTYPRMAQHLLSDFFQLFPSLHRETTHYSYFSALWEALFKHITSLEHTIQRK